MEGVENVELHAGHHEVVQWLGLTFNMDTLIATWVTMAIVILINKKNVNNKELTIGQWRPKFGANCPSKPSNIDSTIFCKPTGTNLRPRVANTVISITIAIVTHVLIYFCRK